MNEPTDLAVRFPQNPLIVPTDLAPSMPGLRVECVLNPGVFQFENKTWLLLRVAERPEQKPGKISLPVLDSKGKIKLIEFDHSDPKLDAYDPRIIRYNGDHYLTTMSHFRLACSEDGVHFQMADLADCPPIFGQGEAETFGIEDCRVTQIGAKYLLTFSVASPTGVGVGMRSTTDWKTIHSHGMILSAHNKDCAIFGEKINGKYFALHRPSSCELGGNYIWLAESPDLEHWGHHRCIAHTRPGKWDEARVGAGAAPIRTEQGWLEIYHGANASNRYCLGALLLDLEQPWKVLARSQEPILEPIAPYEKTGFFGNVVFTNGHLVDGDQVTIYYGASDSVICGAHLSISKLLRSLGV